MRRIPVLIASAAINASTIPAVAEHTSNKDIDASRERWAMVFQIFTASPLPSSARPVEDISDADVSLLPGPSVI
jgi:hypothetical protein